MESTGELLSQAAGFHAAGDLERAEGLYRRILRIDSSHADALHLLGVAEHQRGHSRLAVDYIRRAIDLGAPASLYHNNLGAAYQALDRLDDAAEQYRNAVRISPDSADASINLANVCLLQDKLDEALGWYDRGLQLDPANARAWNNRGHILQTHDQLEAAIDSYDRALEIQQNYVEAIFNRANAVEQSGRTSEAVVGYRDVLRIHPGHAKTWFNLGKACLSQGDVDEATRCFDQALVIEPAYAADAHANLGIAAAQKKAFARAETFLRDALHDDPNHARAFDGLANVLRQTGRLEEAVACCRKATLLEPNNAEMHNNLGAALQGRQQLAAAIECYRRAIDVDGDYAAAHNNLGTALHEQDELQAAVACYRRALQIKPEFADAMTNLGIALRDCGATDDAIETFRRAIKISPAHVEAHFHLATALLQSGRFEEGWHEYEWRWKREEFVARDFGCPEWDGSSLSGKTILILSEQGVGDEIMFASCLQDVVPAAGIAVCIVECEPRLVPLFARSFPTAQVVAKPADRQLAAVSSLGRIDVQAAAGGLPRLLRQSADAFPRRRSYLVAEPERVAAWHDRLAKLGEGLKVGIAWKGGKLPEDRRRRSTTLNQWSGLLRVNRVQFINLQYGDAKDEAARCSAVTIHDWDDADALQDLDNQAAQIAALDLVISVDNATVHMAGALGVRVWTLLPFSADWRWMSHRDDSPWYPSMRLFRQTRPGDWTGLFLRVEEVLVREVNKRNLKAESGGRVRSKGSSAVGTNWAAAEVQVHPPSALKPELHMASENEDSEKQRGQIGQIPMRQDGERQTTARVPRADAERPNPFEAHSARGEAHRQAGRFAEAVAAFQDALSCRPKDTQTRRNLARCLHEQGRSIEAAACLHRALAIEPSSHEMHNNLGVIFQALGRSRDASSCYRRALALKPDFTEALFNLGNACREQDRLDESADCYRQSLQQKPFDTDSHLNLGSVLQAQQNLDDADRCYTRCLEIDPDHAEAHFNRSLVRLQQGRFEIGWNEYEWRWRYGEEPRAFSQPVWDGSPLADRSILIHAEQGVGDEIMFASCIAEIAQQAKECILECGARFVPLFSRSFPGARVVAKPAEHTATDLVQCADVQLAAGSLPRFVRNSLNSFPARSSFLKPDQRLLTKWRTRIDELGGRFKIGISWRGGKDPEVQRRRSTVLAQWAPLFQVPGACFINLQYGACHDERARLQETQGVEIFDWADADPLRDLDNHAAEVAALDLVISVDNATVHLAGGLGTPVWTLLPVACDWRWMTERDDSPWYPCMRLFRQHRFGDWPPVFDRVAGELRRLMSRERTG